MDPFEITATEEDLRKAREIKAGAKRQYEEASVLEAQIEGKLAELEAPDGPTEE